jgi:hypothetical protein
MATCWSSVGRGGSSAMSPSVGVMPASDLAGGGLSTLSVVGTNGASGWVVGSSFTCALRSR